MITLKYYNALLLHMLNVNASPELAEQKAEEYKQKFNSLNKYDHMEIDNIWSIDGFEKSLEMIDSLYEKS